MTGKVTRLMCKGHFWTLRRKLCRSSKRFVHSDVHDALSRLDVVCCLQWRPTGPRGTEAFARILSQRRTPTAKERHLSITSWTAAWPIFSSRLSGHHTLSWRQQHIGLARPRPRCFWVTRPLRTKLVTFSTHSVCAARATTGRESACRPLAPSNPSASKTSGSTRQQVEPPDVRTLGWWCGT